MTFKSEPNLLDRDRRMAEIPDVTNKLCDLLWKFVEVKDGLGISIITYALGKRSDLTNSQLKAIMDRIQLLSVGSLDGYSLDDMFFVGGGIYLFRDHPSQEIEDLAILLLKKLSILKSVQLRHLPRSAQGNRSSRCANMWKTARYHSILHGELLLVKKCLKLRRR